MFMPAGMPGTFMLVSLRSRKPLIMVVLCISWPPMFCLKVILKSPEIGFSSRVRCANEIAVMAEMAKRIAVNRDNLSFIRTPLFELGLGMEGSYQKV